MDYPDYLLSAEQIVEEEKECLEAMTKAYEDAQDIATSKGAKLLVIIHPDPSHIEQIEVVDGDIIPLSDKLKINSIPYIDVHSCMRSSFKGMNLEEYAWPINGHYNEFGYGIMTECIYKGLLNHDKEFFN